MTPPSQPHSQPRSSCWPASGCVGGGGGGSESSGGGGGGGGGSGSGSGGARSMGCVPTGGAPRPRPCPWSGPGSGPVGRLVDAVSTKLAFYPPTPPTYSVRAHPDSGGAELYIQPHARGYPRVPSARVEWVDVPRRKEGGGGTRVLTAFVAMRDPKGRTPARATLLFSHGNAVDLGQMLPVCRDLARALKCNVLAYDYTGYGPAPPPADGDGGGDDTAAAGSRSGAGAAAAAAGRVNSSGGGGGGDGSGAAAAGSGAAASASNALADIAAVFDFARRRYGVKPEDTVLYGQSVGSGPTAWLAVREPSVAGVVLHSPICSGVRVLRPDLKWWPAWLDLFPNHVLVPRIAAPVLVMHGTADEVIHVSAGLQLAALAPNKVPPLIAAGYGHQDLEACPEYLPTLQAFLVRLFPGDY